MELARRWIAGVVVGLDPDDVDQVGRQRIGRVPGGVRGRGRRRGEDRDLGAEAPIPFLDQAGEPVLIGRRAGGVFV